jgi:pimeloyl-ACP methyl ester carboxylesterase
MRPTADALSPRFRVLPFSLRNDARSLDDYVAQVTDTLDRNGVDRAVITGVSFGGLVALRFAALHPNRTRALVLASTPTSRLNLRRRHQLYVRLPWVLGPLFLIETPWRLRAELVAALPDARERFSFKWRAFRTAFSAPVSLSRMAERALLMASTDLRADCAHIKAPTLVVTGERELDHVVPVDGTTEYARLIAGARTAVLERTGHIGTMTRPHAFADLVDSFVNPQPAIRNPQYKGPDAAA